MAGAAVGGRFSLIRRRVDEGVSTSADVDFEGAGEAEGSSCCRCCCFVPDDLLRCLSDDFLRALAAAASSASFAF